MANDNLSGIAVTTHLAKWLRDKKLNYTYRILFIPETIGSIAYLSKHLKTLKRNVITGFNICCVGDDKTYSFLPTKYGDTFADKVALNVLRYKSPKFKRYSFLDRGSDERQYGAPGIDLPVVSVMRSKYYNYPEYHTSLDNLEFISPNGLSGGYQVLKECLELIENNHKFKIKCLGEPKLDKRGLYPTLSTKDSQHYVEDMMNFIAYADGKKDLIEISDIINVPARELFPIIESLRKADLLEKVV